MKALVLTWAAIQVVLLLGWTGGLAGCAASKTDRGRLDATAASKAAENRERAARAAAEQQERAEESARLLAKLKAYRPGETTTAAFLADGWKQFDIKARGDQGVRILGSQVTKKVVAGSDQVLLRTIVYQVGQASGQNPAVCTLTFVGEPPDTSFDAAVLKTVSCNR